MPFFSDSNSTVEWRAEHWDASTQLEWRFKETEGTRNRLLQPPPHGILRVGRRRKKSKNKTKQKIKSTLMSLSCINYPWVICHPLSKTFLLLNQEAMVSAVRAMATVTPCSLCLIQESFLLPNQGIPLHRPLEPRLAFFYSQNVELKETPVSTFSSPSSAI